ncbi:ribonuclease H-like domain-containing protein [Tanacetum coccineum]
MAAYLLNILPSSAIQNDIPCTKLFNKQPDYSRLQIFGCLCYQHLYSPHKLAPQATPCIFLGYPAYHRGYRCLDLSTNKIILSRHVTFDELQFPYGSVTHAHPPSYTFLEPNISPITRHIIQSQPEPPPTTPLHSAQQQTQQPPTQQQTPLSPISQQTAQQQPAPSPTTSTPSTTQQQQSPQSQPSTHNPTPAQNPQPQTHPMITRSQVGTFKPNPRFHGHTSHISPLPKSPSVALSDPHWRDAMYDEYNALIKNGTWILVPKPPNVNVVRSMWLFRHKYHADGSLSRYKARLVANGRNQQYGVDCSDTFSPVVKPATIRTVLSLALARNWPVHQLDVKNAFLNGDLTETVYMYQPPGFVDSRFPHHVCRLQRSLYGLKQAPRAWFQRFAGYALRVGFTSSRCDSSLFIYQHGTEVAYLLIYVDDIVLTASSTDLLQRIISSLHKEFDLTDLGALNYFLGISVTRDAKGMTPVDTESKLGSDRDPVFDSTLYRNLAGGLQYLTFTRPDISYAVQQICLHMHNPREPHLAALKRVLHYILGTLDHGLQLHVSSTSQLNAYTDADWASCLVPLSHSSAEAKYRVVVNVVAETAWIRNLLQELHTPLFTVTLVYYDNVRVLHVPSRYEYADILTKGLPTALFDEFHTSLSVRSSPTHTAGEC